MKKFIVAVMLVLVLGVGTPSVSSAETMNAETISLKEQLLSSLKELVTLLQLQLNLKNASSIEVVSVEVVLADDVTAEEFAAGIKAKQAEFEATDPEYPGKEKVTYTLDDDDSASAMSDADKYLLELIRGLAPTDEVRDSVKELTVYFDEDDTTDASVTPIDDEGNEFVFEINYKAVEDFELFVPVIVHEYTHIFTLLDDQYVSVRENENIKDECENYFTEGEGCFETDAYMNVYFQKFWKDSEDFQEEDRAEDETEEFFETRKDKYVTDYATTNPIEDVAESFMYYTSKDPIASTNVKGEKVNFFNDYTELKEYRDEVRETISSWAK